MHVEIENKSRTVALPMAISTAVDALIANEERSFSSYVRKLIRDDLAKRNKGIRGSEFAEPNGNGHSESEVAA